ncbi:beta-ketoacyl synthase N-terminal-like domain-containing protein [Kitasatospora sp. NPDC002551]|uniref:beta-ketoacyl synthase N-terminal-like domain-containing protein n=1 Tax=Kitasatospora sp. NPDC002551 TaxID=3154539 RepID=UPI00332A98BD
MPTRAKTEAGTLVELLRYRAEHQPDQVGYRFLSFSGTGQPEESLLTWSRLDAWARAVAVTLRAEGTPGDRVLMLCPPGLDYVAYFFGCLYGGFIPVPAYPPGTAKHVGRVQAIALNSGAAIVLTDESSDLADAASAIADGTAGTAGDGAMSPLSQARWLPADGRVLDGREDGWTPPPIAGESTAFLQYTSGSTSTPKGVIVTHRNLIANARAAQGAFGLTTESQSVSWLPPYHDMGLIGGIICPLHTGYTVTLMAPVSFVRDPAVWLEAISRYRGTVSPAPNFAYQMCVERVTEEVKDGLDLSSWVSALNGAEPVQPAVLDRFAAAFERCGFRRSNFYPCYGLAESTLLVSGARPQGEPMVRHVSKPELEQGRIRPPHDLNSVQSLASSGEVASDTEVAIVARDRGEALPPGEVGEIWVRGESVAAGYFEAPESTAETFGLRLANGEGPYLRTGDLGVLMDGELFVTGRATDLMIFRGRNVYPQDVEATCTDSDPSLGAVRAAAFTVEADGEDVLVVVQELPRGRVTAEQAKELVVTIRRRISEEHQLQVHEVVLVPARKIPTTSSGKVQRRACKAQYLEGSLPVARPAAARPAPAGAAAGEQAPAGTAAPDRAPEQAPAGKPADGRAAAARASKPESAPESARTRTAAEIEDRLRELIAAGARIELHEVAVDEPFTSYGIDSIQAVSLAGTLSDWLGHHVPDTLVWEHPTPAAAARALAGELRAANAAQSPAQAPARAARAARGGAEDAIAVIGMGCRFPGGVTGAEGFWEFLARGGSGITEIPSDRWDVEEFFDEEAGAPGRMYVRHGGFVDGVRGFDAGLFGIPPREAVGIDPQHRLVLEVAWEALEHAGVAPDSLRGSRTGVFVGMGSNDFQRLGAGDVSLIDAYSATGSSGNFGANRLSYVLGLEGPSMVVDTACSSSLVALHLAVQSLRAGECETALAGGVNVMLSPDSSVALSSGRMLSAQGLCRTFDASADGYVRGEGAGVVVLKRLSDALAAGDDVLAVVRGSAVNQDGRSNGLTAPSGRAQEDVVRRALSVAGIAAAEVGFVEAHGTGTPLGDPIEVRALGRVLGEGREPDSPVALGSVKTNIGHLEAAAGIAGFIKAVLTVQRGWIPPHLNLVEPNPHVEWADLPVSVPTVLTRWEQERRVAGVSAFGFGGTNAHVVLEGTRW